MHTQVDTALPPIAQPATRRIRLPAMWALANACIVVMFLGITSTAQCKPAHLFSGVLHARGPHGVYTELLFEPHRLVAKVHEPHMCVLRAHLVHGDPHSSRYAIEPPTGGRFCDELVDGEIVIRPRSPSHVQAEFRSVRMDWVGEFHRHAPGH